MLTCYVRNYFTKHDESEILPFISVLLAAISSILIFGYLVHVGLSIINHKLTNRKRHFKKFFFKYLIYGLIFIIFKTPTILLYIITINRTIASPSFFSYLSYVSALCNISIDFALCLVNLIFGHVKLVSLGDSESVNII